MQVPRRFNRYLRTRVGAAALSLVAGTGVLLAFFIGRTFVWQLPQSYRLNFGPAKWIQSAAGGPSRPAYFRKSIYAGAPVEHAWVQISATGDYQLYVNNSFVDENSFPGVRPSGLYDITSLLAQGKNVIAVEITAGNFPGAAQIRVRGDYSLVSSPAQEFYSDRSWRVSELPSGVVGSYPWTSPYLDDSAWSHASQGDDEEQFSTVQPVAFDPAVIEKPPAGRWITPPNIESDSAPFAYSFRLPFARGETWFRIAANGDYDLIVNGWLVSVQPRSPRATRNPPATPVLGGLQVAASITGVPAVLYADSGLPGARMPAAVHYAQPQFDNPALVSSTERAASTSATQAGAAAGQSSLAAITPPAVPLVIESVPSNLLLRSALGSPLLLAYNITPWLRTGTNNISIRVHSDVAPPLLLADGRTYLRGSDVLTFGTDQSWQVSSIVGGAPKAGHVSTSVVADYLSRAEVSLPRVVAAPQSVPGAGIHFIAGWALLIGTIVLALTGLWFLTPMLGWGRAERAMRIWTYDALLHLPVATVLLGLILLSCDIRLPSDFFFTRGVVFLAFALLLSAKVLAIGCESTSHLRRSAVRKQGSFRELARYWPAVLGVIVLVGFVVRLWGLLDVSFAHDEASMARFSEGILKSGLPCVTNGGIKKWLTTYELVPYPMALSSLIFGHTVFAYRLPAALFGSLTVGVIGLAGYRLFDWRSGVVSALVYAFLSSAIQWARDGFYPSQDCFFALLTFWFFYEAVRGEEGLNHRYVTLSCVGFLLTYLSWEGSGFILPTLFLLLLIMRWGRFDWIRDRYLWLMAILASSCVVLQLCIRSLLLFPYYLGIGYDLSEVSTPRLVFLDRVIFNPFYYLNGFLLSENHTVLTILAFSALFAGWRHRGLRYVSTALLLLEFWYTLFLPKYGPRYTFNALPLLVLAAVGFFFQIADAWERAAGFSHSAVVGWIQSGCVGLLLIALCLSSNPYLLKLYRLAADPTDPFYFERVGVQFKPNYRDADLYVARHFRPGDVVMTREPHVFAFYTDMRPKYSTNTLWNSRLNYDGRHDPPRYIDKWYGLPSLGSLQEILDTRTRSPMIWIIKSTGCRREFDFQDLSYLRLWGRTEFETTCEEVVSLRGVSPYQLDRLAGLSDE